MATRKKLEFWDKTYLWHPFTQQFVWEKEPTLIVRSGRGPYFFDVQGKRYLDGVSSLWVNIHGHNHPVLNKALRHQLSKIAHSTFLGLSHAPAIELGRDLARLAPGRLKRTFYSDNGATAVEVALKMAFQYWLEKKPTSLRKEFLALKGSYHGDTIGSVSVGGIGTFHSKFKPLLFKTNFAMAPACFRCPFNKKKAPDRHRLGEKIRSVPRPGQVRNETGCRWECLGEAERILKKKSKKIAAAIIEPVVQGAAGMIVMPPGYVAGLKRLCERADVLFIADEVATGFGRTGTLFACEQERVQPDFLCLAKGLTGGYSPLAATMTTERIFKVFWGPVSQGRTFFHGHSYTAHPLGAAVARANLKLCQSRKLLENSRQKAQLMKDELKRVAALKSVGSVRQAGLMIGIELTSSPGMGARVCKRLLKHGLWLRPLGNVVVVMPPLVTSNSDLRRLIRTVRNVILHETKT